MTSRILSLSVGAFLLGVAAPIAFALAADQAPWIDEEFRRCTSAAIEEELEAQLDAYREYHEAFIRDLETYRDELRAVWQIADEDARRDAVRTADRANRDRVRETKRALDQRLRDIKSTSRDAQRACKRLQSEQKRFVKDLCFNTSDCSGNKVCSTERGDCQSACPPDVQNCIQACTGRCERATSSRSSAGSRSATSLSRGSQASSIRSGCTPYRCSDDREFPACDASGNPINYFQNPCF